MTRMTVSEVGCELAPLLQGTAVCRALSKDVDGALWDCW